MLIIKKGNDTFGDLELTTFKGTDFIYETMEDLKFKVGPRVSTKQIQTKPTTYIAWQENLPTYQVTNLLYDRTTCRSGNYCKLCSS